MSSKSHIARRGRRWLVGLAVATTALVATGSAWADDTTVAASFPAGGGVQATNYAGTIALPKYQPSAHGGDPLLAVRCTVDARIEGSIQAESTDSDKVTILTRLKADVTLSGASPTFSLTANAGGTQNSFNATKYDGILDYGGTSGVTYPNLVGTGTVTQTFTDAATLAAFTATSPGETITLNVGATGESSGSGGGNLNLIFITRAGANYTCTYFHRQVSNTAVALRSTPTATLTAKGVTLRWRTASEANVLGYNVYGLVRGKRVKLNGKLIASKSPAANSYTFRSAKAPTRVWLQTVNLDGTRQLHAARVA